MPQQQDDSPRESSQRRRRDRRGERPSGRPAEAIGPDDDNLPVVETLRVHERQRRIRSMRGILLETINILYKDYGCGSFFHLRQRIQEAASEEELRVAADMLTVISRFHESRELLLAKETAE